MTSDQGYNGWANYETWVVHLWLSNDPYSEEAAREVVKDAADPGKALRELVSEDMPLVEGLWADLLNSALGEVDWDEVAEAFDVDADEEAFDESP